MKFVIPAAISSSLQAGSPATTIIALSPANSLIFGIATLYSSSDEQATIMSALALSAASTPSSTEAKRLLSATSNPATAKKLHENCALALANARFPKVSMNAVGVCPILSVAKNLSSCCYIQISL